MADAGASIGTSSVSNLNTEREESIQASPKARAAARKDAQLQKKLEEISKQLNDVRAERSKLKRFDDGRVHGPKRDYTTVPKKLFSHPKLDLVYGEIMFSPYLTSPTASYPKTTYTMAETLKSLKQKGVAFKDLPPEEKPYDAAQMKKQFIREVCNYNPKFNVPKTTMKSSNGSVANSRSGTANSAVSMKEAGSQGSLRRRQLNPVGTRKHPSATSISLDASGFRPSSMGGPRPGSTLEAASVAMLEAVHVVTVTDGVPESPLPQEEVEYGEDFVDAAEAAPTSSQPSPQKAAPAPADEEIYDADFEHTGPLPPQEQAAAVAPGLTVEVPTAAQPAPVSPAGSLKLRTDLINANKSPQADSGSFSAAPTVAVHVKDGGQPTRPAFSKQGSEEPEVQTERVEQHATPAPSTVRSDIEAPPTGIHSHASSFLEDAIEEVEVAVAPPASTAGATSAGAPSSHQHRQSAEETAQAPLDEPIDEIMYVESRSSGADSQDAAVRSNNYLHSPVRGVAAGGSPALSPTRNMDLPDEEIGEEIV